MHFARGCTDGRLVFQAFLVPFVAGQKELARRGETRQRASAPHQIAVAD
jgi:hypothetical protein